MRIRMMALVFFTLAFLLIDYYFFQAVLNVSSGWSSTPKAVVRYSFWVPTIFSIGALLLGGAGVLGPGRLRLDPGFGPSGVAQVAVPVASAVGVVLVLLAADGLDRATARVLEILIAVTILIVGLRQTMLFLDRAAAAERERQDLDRVRGGARAPARQPDVRGRKAVPGPIAGAVPGPAAGRAAACRSAGAAPNPRSRRKAQRPTAPPAGGSAAWSETLLPGFPTPLRARLSAW